MIEISYYLEDKIKSTNLLWNNLRKKKKKRFPDFISATGDLFEASVQQRIIKILK